MPIFCLNFDHYFYCFKIVHLRMRQFPRSFLENTRWIFCLTKFEERFTFSHFTSKKVHPLTFYIFDSKYFLSKMKHSKSAPSNSLDFLKITPRWNNDLVLQNKFTWDFFFSSIFRPPKSQGWSHILFHLSSTKFIFHKLFSPLISKVCSFMVSYFSTFVKINFSEKVRRC